MTTQRIKTEKYISFYDAWKLAASVIKPSKTLLAVKLTWLEWIQRNQWTFVISLLYPHLLNLPHIQHLKLLQHRKSINVDYSRKQNKTDRIPKLIQGPCIHFQRILCVMIRWYGSVTTPSEHPLHEHLTFEESSGALSYNSPLLNITLIQWNWRGLPANCEEVNLLAKEYSP